MSMNNASSDYVDRFDQSLSEWWIVSSIAEIHYVGLLEYAVKAVEKSGSDHSHARLVVSVGDAQSIVPGKICYRMGHFSF